MCFLLNNKSNIPCANSLSPKEYEYRFAPYVSPEVCPINPLLFTNSFNNGKYPSISNISRGKQYKIINVALVSVSLLLPGNCDHNPLEFFNLRIFFDNKLYSSEKLPSKSTIAFNPKKYHPIPRPQFIDPTFTFVSK